LERQLSKTVSICNN